MKAVIAIAAILGLAGGCYYYQNQARSLAATVAQLETEASETRRQSEKLQKEVSRLKAELDKAKAAPVAETPAKPVVNAPSKPQETPQAPPATVTASDDKTAVLAKLEADYQAKLAELDRKKANFTANLAEAQAERDRIAAAAPQFSEQSARFDEAGIQVGNKGIRTSQRDREKALQLHAEQLAAAESRLATIQAAEPQLQAEYDALRRSYQDAVDAAGN